MSRASRSRLALTLPEVVRACGETVAIACQEQFDLTPVPAAVDVCSRDAFRLRAAADALVGRPEQLAALARHDARTGENLLRGLEFRALYRQKPRAIYGVRRHLERVGREKLLAADFPPDRVYSATELERYAHCPYRYFLETLLKVQPTEDIALEVDYAERGQMKPHDLLAASPSPLRTRARRRSVFARRAFGGRLRADSKRKRRPTHRSAPGGDRLADALREIDRRKLREWLAKYSAQHAKYDNLWKDCDSPPRGEMFEVSFGRELREGQTPPSTAEPLELTSEGATVRLSGRIDRIDIGKIGSQTIFNIVDYKTGGSIKFSEEACRRGGALTCRFTRWPPPGARFSTTATATCRGKEADILVCQ